MSDKDRDKLLIELKSFRRQLGQHDSLIRTHEAIDQFFTQDGNEISIKLIADQCSSEIKVSINEKWFSSRDIGRFDIHELIRFAIKEYNTSVK